MSVRYSKTSWWLLLRARDSLKATPGRETFPPVHPFNRRRMQAMESLITQGIFTEVSRDIAGRLYYTTTLDAVLTAIQKGRPRA